MNIGRPIPIPIMLFGLVALIGVPEGVSFAAKKKPPAQDAARVSPKPLRVSPDASQKALPPKAIKEARPIAAESKTGTSRQPRLMAEKPPSKKNLRVMKAHTTPTPKAVVQPRTDLMHYGILEDSQRYDPRPRADSAGVPSPQTLDLTHDHFQELDRNQDGKIDPVERAFGRIDMDRDLHTRTLQ